ncbi:MAG TPA: DUF72 domain-containing protein, partial [Myxococcales bacterium]|nr:DUF72 domain-containing protein [Myxococcales bacterium]
MIHLGTSGYAYDQWRRIFYPRGLPVRRWLERYAQVFGSVELNATFYRLPRPGAARAWHDATPRGFVFAAKGSRYLTHMKRLTDAAQGLGRYFERIHGLGRKLQVVLWQLPPQMTGPDPARLRAFLRELPRGRLRHAFEFRSEGWYTNEICDVLDERGAAFCEH